MPDYIDYPSAPDDAVDTRKLAILMFVVALIGGLFVAASLFLDKKHPDPLYDVNRESIRTSGKIEVTPDLWKGKHQTPLPEETPTWIPTPVPADEPTRIKPPTPAPAATDAKPATSKPS